MQTNKLTQGIQAHYESALVKTHGASRIKKLIALEKLFVRKRELRRNVKKSGKDGVEGWDEVNQILTLPTLTTYSLPFALPLIDIVFTLPSTLILHLNTNEDGEVEDEDDAALHSDQEGETTDANGELKMDGETERRLIITKWEERSVLDSMLNRNEMVKNLYTSFVLPILSYVLTILAGALFFHHTHRLSHGWIKYAVDASHEAFHAVEAEIVRLMSGDRMKQSARTFNEAASVANAYYQSGKITAQRKLDPKEDNSSSSGTLGSQGSSSAVQPSPSSNTLPNLYRTSNQPSLRLQSPPRATTSSSLEHAQGQHVRESHTTSTNNDLGSATTYAEAVAEGSKLGRPLDGGIENGTSSQRVAGYNESSSYPEIVTE
ncbi:hypothetical protein QFC21_003968 [Naganishia friedmannii]|uniref:Uncharacterized protein n=1 Tax=Naganishia friedmannii TaxID=89922 RepID=A0ACC2VM45_9TREE|nr:hypothetical protein QFC21_003968 [Naganishia friedmannii]